MNGLLCRNYKPKRTVLAQKQKVLVLDHTVSEPEDTVHVPERLPIESRCMDALTRSTAIEVKRPAHVPERIVFQRNQQLTRIKSTVRLASLTFNDLDSTASELFCTVARWKRTVFYLSCAAKSESVIDLVD